MHPIKLITATDKGKIASDKVFFAALSIDVKDETGTTVETIRLVNNNENVTLGGLEYVAYPFNMEITYESGGQPTIRMTAQDVTRSLMTRMQLYRGGIGSSVNLMIWHEDNTSGTPDISEVFDVLSASSSDYTVTWTLGSTNLLDRQFPARRQWRDRCQWKYKSVECGYTGALATCDYTLNGANGCDVHNNVMRFGAFPGLTSARFG